MARTDNFREQLAFDLYKAYLEARKGKRKTLDEHEFELYDFENISNLCDDIISRRYRPHGGIAFIIRDPVTREVIAPKFRDRVVHHYIFAKVNPFWETQFIEDSYSCRIGKGTLKGQQRLQWHLQQAQQEAPDQPVYVIKIDIKGYFMHLQREKLYQRMIWGLEQEFPNHGCIFRLCRRLWREIIFDDPTIGVVRKGWPRCWEGLPDDKSLFTQPPGRGIVIGNLTSQEMSNCFLDLLDRFVQFEIIPTFSLPVRYGRYVDDFYIVFRAEEIEKLLRAKQLIGNFLFEELELTLHPNKFKIYDIHKGVDYLGVIVYKGHVHPGERLRHNFERTVYKVATTGEDLDSLQSYLGFLMNTDSHRYVRKVFARVGWDYPF